MVSTKLRSSSRPRSGFNGVKYNAALMPLSPENVSTVRATTGLQHVQSSIEFKLKILDRLSGASLQALSLPGKHDHLVYLLSHVDSEHFLSLAWHLHICFGESSSSRHYDLTERYLTHRTEYIWWEYLVRIGNIKQAMINNECVSQLSTMQTLKMNMPTLSLKQKPCTICCYGSSNCTKIITWYWCTSSTETWVLKILSYWWCHLPPLPPLP